VALNGPFHFTEELPMGLGLYFVVLSALIVFARTSALAETCSERHAACETACTPALVSSGQQAGGTVTGCRSSCRSRLQSCLRSGIWVHMGSARRGEQQRVERR
jgi:hypothetical protein